MQGRRCNQRGGGIAENWISEHSPPISVAFLSRRLSDDNSRNRDVPFAPASGVLFRRRGSSIIVEQLLPPLTITGPLCVDRREIKAHSSVEKFRSIFVSITLISRYRSPTILVASNVLITGEMYLTNTTRTSLTINLDYKTGLTRTLSRFYPRNRSSIDRFPKADFHRQHSRRRGRVLATESNRGRGGLKIFSVGFVGSLRIGESEVDQRGR